MIVDDFQTFVDAAAGHGTKVDESAIWTLPMPPSESSEFDMVLAPGANTPYRRWPLESFRSLVERLLRAHPFFRFAVVGGREESPLGQSLADAFPGQMTNLCGKTDILGLAAILSPNGGQRIVVANETGTAHLAAVQGTRTIVILGGGDFGALFPSPHRPNVRALFKKRDCFGCGWQCRYADLNSTVAPCVEDIRVEDVVSAIEEWL